MMDDWKITNYVDPTLPGTWVYYRNPNFPNLHFSRCVDDGDRDHVATDDRVFYYFGVLKTFNTPAIPLHTQRTLIDAWNDYFTVG
ncbi:MAG TPA: hypothetical protein DC047_13460 [Blastocatellia bacterium]|nr:hypothetical protein [Blastocatellia bacterium]